MRRSPARFGRWEIGFATLRDLGAVSGQSILPPFFLGNGFPKPLLLGFELSAERRDLCLQCVALLLDQMLVPFDLPLAHPCFCLLPHLQRMALRTHQHSRWPCINVEQLYPLIG